ncbi:ABC transporter ATP-binding protein [Candidatus Gracilibacteria bacterium]|nr:MAG: ABC transporter ATP-binding protein [Candidatus Gracilibacteria bacterium]
MKHLKININSFEFDGELVFKDIDFVLNKNDKVAIVGTNGAGKSTLMKILTGEIKNFDGNIDNVGNLTLGYLKQIYSDNENKLVREELRDAFTKIVETEEELSILEKSMAENSSDMELIEKYTSLLEQYNNIGGNDYKNQIHNVANGIGILELLDKKLTKVSGGQRTKIALAKVLLESPDILFLDEPTNFIDMNSVEWLESFLQNKWKSGYVIISHDREFLDKTCDKTYEVQPKRGLTYYFTNYTGYLAERERIEKRKMDDYKREQEYLEKQKTLINRFRAGSRAGWAKSREKSLEKREIIEAPVISKKPKFFFGYTGETPEKLLSFKECFIGRKEPLFFISELYLYRKQRIGIVGENGVGKSTFIKTILGQINLLDGFFGKGKGLKIGYYSQMHEELDENKTVRENFLKHKIEYPDQQLIGLLSHYLFDVKILGKKVSELSGGERSKILFAILGQKEFNLLILDEPTNHLDYDTRESLEHALNNFAGSILFISHDRYFVNKLSTNIWFISEGELSVSYGNYEDYKFKLENNIDMDLSLWDQEAELNLVLEEKLGEKAFKRIKDKFGNGKKRRN